MLPRSSAVRKRRSFVPEPTYQTIGSSVPGPKTWRKLRLELPGSRSAMRPST
jgi:hypothetical protein